MQVSVCQIKRKPTGNSPGKFKLEPNYDNTVRYQQTS